MKTGDELNNLLKILSDLVILFSTFLHLMLCVLQNSTLIINMQKLKNLGPEILFLMFHLIDQKCH